MGAAAAPQAVELAQAVTDEDPGVAKAAAAAQARTLQQHGWRRTENVPRTCSCAVATPACRLRWRPWRMPTRPSGGARWWLFRQVRRSWRRALLPSALLTRMPLSG